MTHSPRWKVEKVQYLESYNTEKLKVVFAYSDGEFDDTDDFNTFQLNNKDGEKYFAMLCTVLFHHQLASVAQRMREIFCHVLFCKMAWMRGPTLRVS